MRVLVTGAAGELGGALVRAFAARGDDVVALVRTEARNLPDVAGSVTWAVAELGDPARIEGELDRAALEWDTFDAVVHAAASVDGVGEAWGVPTAEWTANLSVNILGAAALVRRVVPAMIERRDGVILCVVSAAARVPLNWLAPYCVAKAGLFHYIRCLAEELAPFGVRANGVDVSFDGGIYRRHRALKDQAGYYHARTGSAPPTRSLQSNLAPFLFACSPAGRATTGQWLDSAQILDRDRTGEPQ